ncbi:MAG: signal peptidase I [Alphaproteobacteria bacterium]|nr:signal peptidase I [Alphaproteobacteria bacterium]
MVLLWMLACSSTYEAKSASMAPAICVGQRIQYGTGPIERGSVVLFPYPRAPEVQYIKRVIGFAGDTIEVRDNVLMVKGKAIERADDGTGEILDANQRSMKVTLHTEALDGKSWTIAKSEGLASPLSTMPEVTVPEGKVFVMGDNRDFSEDSRRWGFVDVASITGLVTLPDGPSPCLKR